MRGISVFAVFLCLFATSHAAAQGGYEIDGKDQNDRLQVFGLLQFRYDATFAQDSISGGSIDRDDVTEGFGYRRVRLGIKGETYDGKFGYELEGETGGGDTFFLLDAAFHFKPADGWKVRVGQFVLQFQRENAVAPWRMLAVDRSSQAYNVNPYRFLRTQGFEVQYRDETQRLAVALHAGAGSFNANYVDDVANIAGTVRYERALVGTLAPFKYMNGFPDTDTSLMVGAGLHAEDREDDGLGDGGGDRYAFTADINYATHRFAASLVGNGHIASDLNRHRGGPMQPEQIWGFIGQAGYFLIDELEVFSRYEWATTSDESMDELSVITAGFNWYILGNAFKLATDVNYSFESVESPFDRVSDGLLGTQSSGEVVFRAQIQVVF